ncbi:MAG: hypothetical protein IPO20_07850 [Gammaproteobacteria bacterium]|nr:hypothetical protein [Gammaproteobacteria bacterium]
MGQPALWRGPEPRGGGGGGGGGGLMVRGGPTPFASGVQARPPGHSAARRSWGSAGRGGGGGLPGGLNRALEHGNKYLRRGSHAGRCRHSPRQAHRAAIVRPHASRARLYATIETP